MAGLPLPHGGYKPNATVLNVLHGGHNPTTTALDVLNAGYKPTATGTATVLRVPYGLYKPTCRCSGRTVWTP